MKKENFFDTKFKAFVIAALIMLTVFLLIQSWATFASIQTQKNSVFATKTITGRGTAKVNVVPDVASFSVTIRELAQNVEEAQQKMSKKGNQVLDLLKAKNIEDKNIKTTNYATYPKYEYQTANCSKNNCPAPKRILSGYEAYETISVKLYDTKQAGEILTEVAKLSVGEVSGLNFSVEDTEKFRIQAREEAIKKAQEDAKLIAKSLDIKLGEVTSFNDGNMINPPFAPPHMLMKTAELSSFSTPQIKEGEQSISATVAISYEIK